jgi:hypothetical protein
MIPRQMASETSGMRVTQGAPVCGKTNRLSVTRATTQEEFLLISQKRSKIYGI